MFGIGEYRPWSTRSNLKRHSGLLNLPRRQRSERRGGEVNGAPRPCRLRSTLDHLVIGSGALSDDLETITVEVLPAQPAELGATQAGVESDLPQNPPAAGQPWRSEE